MPIDFFKVQCCTNTSEIRFGICDDDDELPAYIDSLDENIWIATVLNDDAKAVTFTAIDKCIDFPLIDGDMQSRCDVMLTCDNCLYVIELKNKRSDWQSSGIEQLEATIQNLIAVLGATYNNYRFKKAYVANKRHPNFHVIENETMEKFRDLYRVRLDLQATIRIV
jgi:hypothetical protein